MESWSSLDSDEVQNILRAKVWAHVIFDLDGTCLGTSLRGEKMTIENRSCEWLVSLDSVMGHLSMPWRFRMLIISLKKNSE
jgi:hypothetical protein